MSVIGTAMRTDSGILNKAQRLLYYSSCFSRELAILPGMLRTESMCAVLDQHQLCIARISLQKNSLRNMHRFIVGSVHDKKWDFYPDACIENVQAFLVLVIIF